MKIKRDDKALLRIIDRLGKGWQADAQKAIELLYTELEAGKKVEQAIKAVERNYPQLFTLPELKPALVEAAAYGYGIVPTVLSVAQAASWGEMLAASWTGSGMSLSQKLHGSAQEMRAAIISTIKQQLKLNSSWVGAARALYDGYSYGNVVREQDLPKYLQTVRRATQGSPEQLRSARIALRNISRLAQNGAPARALRAAYEQLIKAALTGSSEALQKACYTAIQEKSRYVAERIIRTETARAWADGFFAACMEDPDCVAVRWKLSSRHPVHDICDMYARADMFGLGAGIYPKDKVPPMPVHPHCLCRAVEVYAGEVDIHSAKNNIRQAGDKWLQGLSEQQRQNVLGIKGAKDWADGGDWMDSMRGWQGLHKPESRLKNGGNRDIIKVKNIPLQFKPNAITDCLRAQGGIDRNYYGTDGWQYKQVSNHDHGNPKAHPFGEHGEHAHDYAYTKDGELVRGKARELKELERKEAADIL